MKKCIPFVLLFAAAGIWSCADDLQHPKLSVSQIPLLAPETGTTYELTDILHVVFAWDKAFLVDNYELVMSASEDLASPVVKEVRRSPHLITATDMNDIASVLGIPTSGTGTIYWTVRSGKSSQPSEAPVWKFSVSRLASQPLSPVNNTVVVIDHEAFATELEFEWEPLPEVDSYTLVISTNADLTDPFAEIDVATTSETLTHRELQDLIEDPSMGLKRYKQNTIYWNIRANGRYMAPSAWNFKLSGARIFTDVRGNESITYPVAVIDLGSSEAVWLGENLRATKDVNGNDLLYEGQDSWNSQYFFGSEAQSASGVLLPEAIRELAGAYYRLRLIGDNTSSIGWPSVIIPDGWKAAELSDFEALAEAAAPIGVNFEVLRSVKAYPSLYIAVGSGANLDPELMNLWNMNMGACGTNRVDGVGSLYVAEFGALDHMHMVFAIQSVTQCVTIDAANKIARAIGLGVNAPITVRMLYSGDD